MYIHIQILPEEILSLNFIPSALIADTFMEQSGREKQYREEMTRQLQIVKGNFHAPKTFE